MSQNQTEYSKGKKHRGLQLALLIILLIVVLILIYVGARHQRDNRPKTPVTIVTSAGPGTTATYQVASQANFEAMPKTVESGHDIVLEWNVPGAKSVQISPLEGTFGPSGRHIISKLEDSTKYTLTATMEDGNAPVKMEQQVIVTHREGSNDE